MSTVDQEKAQSATTEAFITALVFNGIVFGAELAVFTVLRPYFPSIYQPRTYVPSKSKRAKPLVEGKLFKQLFYWPFAVFRSDYRAIRRVNGMDAYFFVRFLRMMVKIFAPIWIISWAVLLPVTSVNSSKDGFVQLDKFTFGNVENSKQARYAAHVILCWLFTGWIIYVIKTEMRNFVITRQKYLMGPERAASVQANTLLITGIPAKYLNPTSLRHVFDKLPGGVRGVWINRNLQSLPETYDRQVAACGKLESAETKLLGTRTKLLAKNMNNEQGAEKYEVPKGKRPTHKLGFLGLFGEKVDSVEWGRQEVSVAKVLLGEGRAKIQASTAGEGDTGAVPQVKEEEEEPEDSDETRPVPKKHTSHGAGHQVGGKVKNGGGKIGKPRMTIAQRGKNLLPFVNGTGDDTYPPLNSAFILFHKQIGAHLAKQVLVHHEPYRMTGRYIEVAPRDVIWGNLGLNPYEMKVRKLVSWAATAGLIILWAIPVAFVGAISNITSLCEQFSWLRWLCTLPSPVNGIIQGILPPVLLAVLMMLLPIVLRRLARFEGIPTQSACELSLMNRFFIFQVVHGFFIVSLASGIIASLEDLLNNPTSIPGLLAENLPKASTFFLTYVILQGLAGTAGGFLQIVALAIYYVKLVLLGSTPRSVWGIKYGKRSLTWGTAWPGITLLTTICLGYSIISPIINGLACFAFLCFFMLYKYLFLWVFDTSETADTGGLFFPNAVQHLFVGLYVQQVCLGALFFLAQNDEGSSSAIPQGAMMVVLILFTALFQMMINNSYGPLLHALPLSLADKMHVAPEVPAVPEDKKIENGGESSSSESPKDLEQGKITSESRDPINSGTTSSAVGAPPPALAERQLTEDDEYGFAHPAVSRPQRTIWIPRDQGGAWEKEVRGCKEMGVSADTRGAVMNGKGKVDIKGAPPDVRGWWEENAKAE